MGDEHKLYNEYFFPNKLRKIKVSRVKKPSQTADAYSYLAVAHSLESRKHHTDHYVIRFDQNLKMKRQYHISEILGVQPDYENNCLTLIFHNHHSIRGALLNSTEKESREFYFKSKAELSGFTQEVQKSVIDTGNEGKSCTFVGDTENQTQANELQQLRNKVVERGEKLNELLETSERMQENARIFAESSKKLRQSYE